MKYCQIAPLILLTILTSCTHRERALTPQMITEFASQTAAQTFNPELRSNSLAKVLADIEVVDSADTTCTYRVATQGITDQSNSGRCWLFSTLNILRSEMIERYDLGYFQFSQTYGQFWDVLEKSNRFLENVVDNRRKPLTSRMNQWLFNKPIGDGGHFANAAHVITKYGVVPREVMPEAYSSTDNAEMMRLVLTLLRRYGLQLREAPKSQIADIKKEALAEIYSLLTATLGTPPEQFVWTMTDRNGNTLSTESYTPQSFRERFVGHDLENDYIIFMDDPTRPYGRTYEVDCSRNCYELENWHFVNLPTDKLSKFAVNSLREGRMFYVSADTSHDAMAERGVYDTHTFDYQKTLGINASMSKREMIESCESRSAHAIAVAGVKLDAEGKPVKWLIENSFGTQRGWDGFVVMSQEWFERYLFRMVVEKRFVDDEILRLYSSKPVVIPAWNPTY